MAHHKEFHAGFSWVSWYYSQKLAQPKAEPSSQASSPADWQPSTRLCFQDTEREWMEESLVWMCELSESTHFRHGPALRWDDTTVVVDSGLHQATFWMMSGCKQLRTTSCICYNEVESAVSSYPLWSKAACCIRLRALSDCDNELWVKRDSGYIVLCLSQHWTTWCQRLRTGSSRKIKRVPI